ncbi:unnamed protein product (macronuclear) [Paramecium tetraurelia]|uniref:Uncharacterized protein n=1 Tax=Paramecium tetraurelia TaxID=5888 RepID=A0DEP5_PARTE|nr:uncharacterized protein GSPATT00016338001 [Paramecium tetraurelia]CAK81512.1 unnamed protein product [Paramecium tetraurelia]|eukprot:XP_001448909.1 hypothetical protein (macronuclear) [Paramecium tetraurelia strain d4-2]
MITLLTAIFLMVIQEMAKKQKDFLFDLKEGNSKSLDLSTKQDKHYIILNVRSQDDDKNSDLGEAQVKSSDDTHKRVAFYESAIFNSKIIEITLKCITSLCKGNSLW